MLSLEELCVRTKGGNGDHYHAQVQPAQPAILRMTAMNMPGRFELVVDKDIYTIGKNPTQVDVAVTFNKMISRVHCRITRKGKRFSIMDLQSANGTFVNNVRLHPNQPCILKSGDIVRLANSAFQISID